MGSQNAAWAIPKPRSAAQTAPKQMSILAHARYVITDNPVTGVSFGMFLVILLCGLFVARDQMAGWLETISDVLPLSYAVSALQHVGRIDGLQGVQSVVQYGVSWESGRGGGP